MGRQQQLIRARPIDQRIAYEAVSYLDYRTDVALTEFARSFYASVPRQSNERTQELATRMRGAAGTDVAYHRSRPQCAFTNRSTTTLSSHRR